MDKEKECRSCEYYEEGFCTLNTLKNYLEEGEVSWWFHTEEDNWCNEYKDKELSELLELRVGMESKESY